MLMNTMLRLNMMSETASSAVYAFSYSYDATGNRLQMRREASAGVETESAYYAYAADNSLTKRLVQPASTGTYYYYDNNGSRTVMVEGGSPTYYQYGPHVFITAIAPPSEAASYFCYDGRLNRYCINNKGLLTYYLWDGLNLLEERDNSGNLIARYTNGYTQIPGIGSVVEVQRIAGGTTYFQYLSLDHRGSVYAVTDANQSTQLSYVMDAFGRQLTGIGGASPVVPNSLIYQTNWMTLQIGSKWYGLSPSRVYDFETGTFLSRDPIPSMIKVVSQAEGNALGIFGNTKFADTVQIAIDIGLKEHDLYSKWFLNVYRAWSSNPAGDVDLTGLLGAGYNPKNNTSYGTPVKKELWEYLLFACATTCLGEGNLRPWALNEKAAQISRDAIAYATRSGLKGRWHEALRHCIALGNLTREAGADCALCVGQAREDWQDKYQNQPARNSQRAKFNNPQGVDCGLTAGDPTVCNVRGVVHRGKKPATNEEVIACCKSKLNSGQLDDRP